ncbi:MAG TPA: FHA domain-containing protein [Polyangia bacterium]|nr:FHA domain-containing protein [Polyangia bacterium]
MPSKRQSESDRQTLRAPRRSRVLGFRSFRLQVKQGPDRRLQKDSSGADPEFSVGTAPANQLVLKDPLVSRHHLVVSATPRGFYMRDLGSTNGTFLGNCRVETAYLEPGTQLRIGNTTLRFSSLDERAYIPLSDQGRHGLLIGESPAMRRIFEMLPRIAATDFGAPRQERVTGAPRLS